METLVYILAVMFWLLMAMLTTCLILICYIKLTYLKWDKDEREIKRIINHINSE